MKKFLSLLLVMLLITGLFTGCEKNEKNTSEIEKSNSETVDNGNDDTSDNEPKEEVSKEPITFTMYSAEANANYDEFKSPVAQKIKELTGVTLEIENEIGTDPKQRLGIMAASGDYPDLVYAKGDLNLLKDAGGIVELDDLIEEHGSNIKKLFGDYLPRLKWSLDDPHIYYVGTYPVHEVSLKPAGAFWLQHAVVKELGYPEIKTLDDFEKAIKDYYAKNPKIDGQDTIPITILADGWRFLISVTNPAWAVTGGSDDGEWYVDPETYKAVRHHTREEEKEYFRWLNHMNNEGLLDPESFTQKYDQYKAKIASGRVLALTDAEWEISEGETALRQSGLEERMHGPYPIVLNESTECRVNQSPGYTGGWGVSITKSCKDPVRAIQFLDWMATEEAQILTHWGIEGEHWEYDSNGKRVFLPEIDEQRRNDTEFSKKTGIGNYAYPFPEWGNGIKDSTDNYVQPDSEIDDVIANYTDTEKEILAGYGVKTWMDLFPSPEKFTSKPWGATWMYNIDDPDLVEIDNKVRDDIGMRLIPKAILASPDKFDEIWDQYLKEMDEADLPKLTEAMNKLIQEKMELWQSK
jgi:putative aldouronate transport system substrate-binding protein